MDRVDEWQVFVEVARRLSFAETARALRRSPQAVTRAVAALEDRVGTRLLHRTTRSVTLTSDGADYLARAQRALAELATLETPADADPALHGMLAITAPVLFGQLHVLPVVAELLAAEPALAVRLELVDHVVSLADERIDVGIRIGALADSALRARVVGRVRSVLCASAAYLDRAGTPKRLEDLARHACVAFTGTTPNPTRWTFPGASIAVTPRLTVTTGHAAIEAARQGLGITRLYSYQIEGRDELRVVLAKHEPEPLPIHIVQLPGVPARAATAFVELAAERLAKRLR